jgi:predicted secreted Zn-dependent protease
VRAFAVLLAPLAVLGPQGAQSELCPIEPTISWYDVQGDTPAEIRASMIERGPKDDRGRARFAYASWSVKWKWKLDEGAHVDLSTMQISCKGHLTLPRYVPRDNAPVEIAGEWEAYLERLIQHENRHLQHPVQHAHRIRQRLAAAEARYGELSAHRANQIVQAVIQQIREMDRLYDHETNHGKTEGTWSIVD